MKQFVLDYSKWRSGGNFTGNIVGKGNTELLNSYGFMCCLGQASLQLGCTLDQIKHNDRPEDTFRKIVFLTKYDKGGCIVGTKFSDRAISINDDGSITIDERIAKLRALFKSKGIRMKVINRPK